MKLFMPMPRTLLACVGIALLVSACGTLSEPHQRVQQAPARAVDASHGVVRSVEVVDAPGWPNGAGAVAGGVVGGLLGNQIGSGGGRAAATIAGAVGGAFLGNSVQKRHPNQARIYRVVVLFDSGVTQTFEYRELDGLKVGDRVRLSNGVLGRG
ncbi:glycine zipper 2TM domain-containing protein [Ramlibacter montanisoli]|nr:glycine zipper 2TM domain-containing protein [Ramlibacter montanisoli]